MKIKNILILAGGDSTRFWPLGDKNTSLFLNRPLVIYLIESLSKFAENVIVVTNPMNDALVKQLSPIKIQTVIIKDPSRSTMGKAVIDCKNTIQGEVLILNAVDIFDFEILTQFINELSREKKEFLFLAKKLKQYFPGAYVVFDGKQVKEFVEKPAPDKVPSDITKLVADYFNDFQRFIKILEETNTKNDDLYEQGINAYITDNKEISYVTYDDYWYTLKYPWHVLAMMKHFLHTIKASQGKNVSISKTTLVVGPVYIGDNVKIGDFTKIVGPTFIGNNTIIGDHTLVRESHIGENVLVGGGSEVARSYLSDGVLLHRNYVGDSVLGEKVLMGAGAVTANFRFDGKKILSKVQDKKIDSQLNKFGAIIGKGSKIGVNCTLLPGVKIGTNTCIGPGEVVKDDVGDNIFLFK